MQLPPTNSSIRICGIAVSSGVQEAEVKFGGYENGIARPRPHEGRRTRPSLTLDELEHDAILGALDAEGGNRKRAAARLGIGLRTLYNKLKKYGVASDD